MPSDPPVPSRKDDSSPDERRRPPRSPEDLRELRDPKAIRALAHPIRLQLLEVLGLEGPLTATRAAELIGETPTTCSFHLRQLQKYGFVEDTGPRGGRERPWQLSEAGRGNRIPGWTGEAALDVAVGALNDVLLERSLAHLRNWWRQGSSYPEEWRNASSEGSYYMFVTAAELEEMLAEIATVAMRYSERIDPALRPPDGLPVELFWAGFPFHPPPDPEGD